MTDREVLSQARIHALSLLESVDHYPYHNVGHTLDVYVRASYLADLEGVGDEEKTDLLIAAIFHDTGFSQSYLQNETIGADLAERFLQGMGYANERVNRVRRIILATILFSRPSDLLEKIIQDADLDNLGRRDSLVRTDALRQELQLYSPKAFDETNFLSFAESLLDQGCSYNTETEKRERDEGKSKNLEAFRSRYR